MGLYIRIVLHSAKKTRISLDVDGRLVLETVFKRSRGTPPKLLIFVGYELDYYLDLYNKQSRGNIKT